MTATMALTIVITAVVTSILINIFVWPWIEERIDKVLGPIWDVCFGLKLKARGWWLIRRLLRAAKKSPERAARLIIIQNNFSTRHIISYDGLKDGTFNVLEDTGTLWWHKNTIIKVMPLERWPEASEGGEA